LAQSQGGIDFQPADILTYFEELKLGPNTEIGIKDIFEMASINLLIISNKGVPNFFFLFPSF
jgi:hypothetical protein